MQNGWIKLFRKITDCDWYNHRPFDKAHAWVDLLLHASYHNKTIVRRGRMITIAPGELATSCGELARRWGWDRETVSRYLVQLEKLQQIQQRRNNTSTFISISNWVAYQADATAEPTAKPAAAATANATAEPVADGGTIGGINQKKKEEKNIKKKTGTKVPVKEEIPFSSEIFKAAWERWEKHRAEKRSSLTPSTAAMQLKKLGKLPEADAVAMIDHSIEQGYLGLVAPKGGNGSGINQPRKPSNEPKNYNGI